MCSVLHRPQGLSHSKLRRKPEVALLAGTVITDLPQGGDEIFGAFTPQIIYLSLGKEPKGNYKFKQAWLYGVLSNGIEKKFGEAQNREITQSPYTSSAHQKFLCVHTRACVVCLKCWQSTLDDRHTR